MAIRYVSFILLFLAEGAVAECPAAIYLFLVRNFLFNCFSVRSLRPSIVVILYSITLFFSAFLLFALQPMVGKVLLPFFGGTPGVWNVCLVFFQSMLLGGYIYANRLSRIRKFSFQVLCHLALLIFALFFLRKSIFESVATFQPSIESPIFSLLLLLVVSLAVPFLLLSATSSLLQSWFSESGHARAKDPYFLFVSSNLGSLLALIAYPFFLEPNIRLSNQFQLWKAGYFSLFILIFVCALFRLKNREIAKAKVNSEREKIIPRKKAHWFILSFIPSSLLIGVTTFLSADVAAFPLLWLIPLVLYLGSFIVAFSQVGIQFSKKQNFLLGRATAFLACVVIIGIILESSQPAKIFLPANLILFFIVAILCHIRLVQIRPASENLTEFYFWISLGGAAGGIFNTMIAPKLFSVVAEYPILILLGTIFRSGSVLPDSEKPNFRRDFGYALLVSMLFIFLSKCISHFEIAPTKLVILIVLGIPMILAYRTVKFPQRYALAVGLLYISSLFFFSSRGHHLLYRVRTFYSTLKVETDANNKFTMLFHGSTLHGRQLLDSERHKLPIGYYSKGSPVSEVFQFARKENGNFSKVGIIGLGTGTLAAYGLKGEQWSFYEIDPMVIHLARDSNYFSYLKDSEIFSNAQFLEGDARIRLKESENSKFDLLIFDAFSSDSIPTHLLTAEALSLYQEKLKSGGIMLFHVSSWYFNLAPVLGSVAKNLGMQAFLKAQYLTEEDEEKDGRVSSKWIVVTKDEVLSKKMGTKLGWKALDAKAGFLWTDDYSNILRALSRRAIY